MSEHSSENLDQSLSALMDNEASELEFRRLLKSGAVDEDVSQELGQKWRRYHLASSIMRKDTAIDMQIDISEAVSIAIDQEDSHSKLASTELTPITENQKADTAKNRSWKDMFIQSSIAASVAVACVLGVQQFNSPQESPMVVATQSPESFVQPVAGSTQQARVFDAPDGFNVPMAKASAVAAVTEQQRYTPVPNRRVQSNVDTAARRNNERLLQLHFEQLMREHAQTHRNNGNMGFLPYARVPNAEKQQ